MADVTNLLRRYDRAVEMRRNWEPLWQDLADLILPRRSNVTTMRAPGSKQTANLFDSTAIHANELLSASMQGSLTSAAVRWFHLRMRRAELNEVPAVIQWLDECALRLYVSFQQSNFNAELQEVYQDLGAFGIGALLVEEKQLVPGQGFGGFRFHALSVGEYAIDENAEGLVDTLYRKFRMSARAAFDRWGAKVGERILKLLEKDPYQPVELLHAVYPREKKKRGYTSKTMPFASCYVHVEGRHEIAEGGFEEFPYCVPRWTKTSGEVYGRGPGHTALPDIKTLNKAVEMTLQAWAIAIRPPMEMLDDGLIGSPKIFPAGVNTVRAMGNIKPLDFGSKLDIAQIKEESLKRSIQQMFYWDQLQLQQGPQMTATEVERRYELMQRVLGPTLGRLESELLEPLIERGFYMLLRAGALPPPPGELLEAEDDAEISIQYEGPLARAQRGSEILAVQRTMEHVIPLAELDPGALDPLDIPEITRFIAESSGIPNRLLRSKRDVKKMSTARAQASAKVAKQEEVGAMAESLGKATPALTAMQESTQAPEVEVPA